MPPIVSDGCSRNATCQLRRPFPLRSAAASVLIVPGTAARGASSSCPANLAFGVCNMRFSLLFLCGSFVCNVPAQAEDKAPDWIRVTDKAEWQPRDSQGELVYRDQLWIMGGWFDSFKAAPRDV